MRVAFRVHRVLLLALFLSGAGGVIAWALTPGVHSPPLVFGCNVRSACVPHDCALPRGTSIESLPGLSAFARAAERDARSRSREYCSKFPYGCVYSLVAIDSGFLGKVIRHPFAGPGQTCVYTAGGELSYIYAADGQFVRQPLVL